jgi:diacylglycerol kinase
MSNPKEVAALQRRVDELGRLLEKASRGLFASVQEERRLTIGVVRLLVEAIISVGTQLTTLQWALIHSAAVSDQQLKRARAELQADLSVEIL